MREKLIELIRQGYSKGRANEDWDSVENTMADYLLQNGVIVLSMDGNDFNPDLYCPYCGNNLSDTNTLGDLHMFKIG